MLFSGKPINFSNVCPIPVAPLRFDLTQFFDFNLLNAFVNSLKVIVFLGMYYLLRNGIPFYLVYLRAIVPLKHPSNPEPDTTKPNISR